MGMTTHPLLRRAQTEKTPLLDGNRATFVWQGTTAPYLKGDWNGWDDPITLTRLAPDVWVFTAPFDSTAYVEYAYFTDPDDDKARLPDPFNPRRVPNGVGAHNHFFGMAGYRPTPLIQPTKNNHETRGKITRHTVRCEFLVQGKRDLWLYAPPTREPVPLLLVWDGWDYLRRAKVATMVDRLTAQGQMRPHAIAFFHNGGARRFLEYGTTEPTLFALQNVADVAREHLNLVDIVRQPGAYAVLGASLGGLMAMFAGLRLPSVFGTVISQAGAFDIAPFPDAPSLIRLIVAALPRQPLNIWQDVGTLDWLLTGNRTFRDALRAKGYPVTYREYAAGHNYTAWRNALPEALTTMLPAR